MIFYVKCLSFPREKSLNFAGLIINNHPCWIQPPTNQLRALVDYAAVQDLIVNFIHPGTSPRQKFVEFPSNS